MDTNANTKLYDKALDRSAMLRLYERRVANKVSSVLKEHHKRLDGVFEGVDLKDKQLMASIDKELIKAFKEAKNVTETSFLSLVADQLSYTYQLIENSIGHIWRTERPAKRVAEELVLKKPLYKDRTLAAGWSNISVGERMRIEALIRKGIAAGKTSKEIALEVRKGSIHSITMHQSQTLTTTALTSVVNQADHAVYEANAKAIRGWQFIAILDSHTTSVCVAHDGKIYDVGDCTNLPPLHYGCRSKTVPVFISWADMAKLEGVAQVRRDNLQGLTAKQKAFYDGNTPLRESYDDWLKKQPTEVQLRHLGNYKAVEALNSGAMTVDKFTNPAGNSIGVRELRMLSDDTYTLPNDTKRFANAKAKLDSMQLGASTPEDFLRNPEMAKTLEDYYLLQAGELNGTLSTTNYRGTLIGNKQATKKRVLSSPPREDQLKFNPITGRYEDVRLYQPNPGVLANNRRLVNESTSLLQKDKAFINTLVDNLTDKMSVNERAVVMDNLRITFGRFRDNGEVWGNFKAVSQSQIKFDVMNVSDAIETQLRKDSDVLKKLMQDNYIDPVLGPVQLEDIEKHFIDNIRKRNLWEDSVAPRIARELRGLAEIDGILAFAGKSASLDAVIAKQAPLVWKRLNEDQIKSFYLRFAHRLSMADGPDRDALAVSLGRDLFNSASFNGSKKEWYDLGLSILEQPRLKKFYEVETFGVQKRRMKSRMSGAYFGPYYDTLAYNIRIVDPRIQEYSHLQRAVELGLRTAVRSEKNKLVFREGSKTYWIDRGVLGLEDTRIPITSTNSFKDFPEEFIDKSLTDALNWASDTKYKVDPDFYDFINKLLYFKDDKGKAAHYDELNEYRKYITARGDAYERFKSMEWLRKSDSAFSNHAFVDHRARVYDRGLISPQSGETFRPFLNTAEAQNFSAEEFKDMQDQIGAFLGGLSDELEGNHNSLTITGRQKVAAKWRPEILRVGYAMRRAKPNDIRAVLESPLVHLVEGEEQGKFFRFAIEMAKIDEYLGGDYAAASLKRLKDYKIALALEQDASSSGAQIIALTTRNKQLAEMSNVVPTNQKRRLYDEIAAATYNDPRFKKLNEKFGLTEKDLRKAAKAQNMVSFYGAGERTGTMNVEAKLGKVLGKDSGTLVVKAAERDAVLDEISAQAARYDRFDKDTADELRALRKTVRDIFNKGIDPGYDILDQLYFLQPQTRDFVEKLTAQYDRVVTPEDFKQIASIMSDHLREQVPILKDFTKFFGRLAEDFLLNAKPSEAAFDWVSLIKQEVLGGPTKGYTLSDRMSELLGLKAGEPLSEKVLKRLSLWKDDSNLHDIVYGVPNPELRRTGGKYFKLSVKVPSIDLKNATIGSEKKLFEIELFKANKMPKKWTQVPWVNFDGHTVEQHFTQSFEEKLVYKNKDGEWTTNILQVPQKTSADWWDEVSGADGKFNDIADVTKARTAFAVNGNHSNDAVIVKNFHLWGKANGIGTSTIHDAFFANAAHMLRARSALRGIYAKMLDKNVIEMTLNEMLARGLPKELYDKYRKEAVDIGLIPVVGKSTIGGKRLTAADILKAEDILKVVPDGFKDDFGWYGVG